MLEIPAEFPNIAVPGMPAPKWVDAAGIRTCYFEAGLGQPIVFIYGGSTGVADSAESAGGWNLNIFPLAQRYRVIAYDKVGQGYSDNHRRDEDYTIGEVVRHAADFIEALELPPVHIVGHSRGGYAATRLSLERPDLIRTLTIINSSTLAPGVGTNEVVLAACPYPPFSRESIRWIYEQYCFAAASVTEEWVDVVDAVMRQEKYRDSVRKMVNELLYVKCFLPQLARQKRETLNWISEGRLQRPVHIVWGFNDRTATVERGIELFRMIEKNEARTTFNVVNQSGHFPYREQPQRFNALLLNLLAGHE
jgi:2-hydroxy-6-oxonona-2,4-dienedioate hydrolase